MVATSHRFVVTPEAAGERLDTYLAAQGLPYSRSQLKRRIDEGEVTVNDVPARPAHKLRVGDAIAFAPPPPVPAGNLPQDIPLTVLHEDADLIAIDKPAGLVVHPAAGHADGTLVNALLHLVTDLSGIGGELRPGIVHRLDKDTSGVLVVAKHDVAHAALAELFKAKDERLLRLYRAVVSPAPKGDAGTIETFYGRHPVDRKRFTSRLGTGKRAITHWRVVERFDQGAFGPSLGGASRASPSAALIECRLKTGRTHQIRVHLADQGWPILGDPVYGKRPKDAALARLAAELGRQALHAAVLELVHPRTGERMRWESALPPDLERLLAGLRGRG